MNCRKLGEGGFSKVRLATHILTGIPVAIKCMDKSRIGALDEHRIQTEISVLSKLFNGHPNVCKMYHVVQSRDGRHVYLVLEYTSGGELFDYIVSKKRLTEDQTRGILRQLLSCLEFIHSKGFAHRDLKPENILLKSAAGGGGGGSGAIGSSGSSSSCPPKITLIDFGLAAAPGLMSGVAADGATAPAAATTTAALQQLETCCGSPAYAAPELISSEVKSYDGRLTDVWSLGIITYALLVGQLPFDHESISTIYQKILSGRYFVPSFLSSEAKDFLTRTIAVDPRSRWSVKELMAHPFMASLAPGGGADRKGLDVPSSSSGVILKTNLDEELIFCLKKKFFPEVQFSQLKSLVTSRGAQGGRNNYYCSSYHLIRDHPDVRDRLLASVYSNLMGISSGKSLMTTSSRPVVVRRSRRGGRCLPPDVRSSVGTRGGGGGVGTASGQGAHHHHVGVTPLKGHLREEKKKEIIIKRRFREDHHLVIPRSCPAKRSTPFTHDDDDDAIEVSPTKRPKEREFRIIQSSSPPPVRSSSKGDPKVVTAVCGQNGAGGGGHHDGVPPPPKGHLREEMKENKKEEEVKRRRRSQEKQEDYHHNHLVTPAKILRKRITGSGLKIYRRICQSILLSATPGKRGKRRQDDFKMMMTS